jgi:hypothetical protein
MKANNREKKMTTKQILTRNEQMRKMKVTRPMKSMMKPYPTEILLAIGIFIGEECGDLPKLALNP